MLYLDKQPGFVAGRRQVQVFLFFRMIKRTILLLTAIVFLIAPSVYATFSLSVSPLKGGTSISFGRVGGGEIKTEEVRVRVSSTLGVQYQVRQKLLEPLRNERGELLNSEALISYTLRGSNSYGSLYQDTPYPLDTSERLLYTSSSGGDSDSFIVVYSVDGNKVNVRGKFLGRIVYRLIPLTGKGREQEVIVNLYFDTEKEFGVKLTTSSGSSKKLKLSPRKKEPAGSLSLNIEGDLGKQYQIYQTLEEPFKKDGIPLENIVKFSLVASKGTSYYSSPIYLGSKPLLVYLSNPQGEKDKLLINFFIEEKDIEKLAAGTYRARLVYNIESQGTLIKSLPLNLELDIEPVFDIEVKPEFRGGIYFRDLKPESSLQQEVYINVKTNIARPYQVIQRLASPLTSERGGTIPLKFFTFRVEKPSDKPGESLFPNFTPLKLEDIPVFISDGKGAPSQFRIIYSLKVPKDILAGDYFTKISYSLLER